MSDDFTVSFRLSRREVLPVHTAASDAKASIERYARDAVTARAVADLARRERETRFDPWFECGSCGTVIHDPDLDLVTADAPMRCCGGRDAPVVWPDKMGWFREVREFDVSTPSGARAKLLFLAAACEAQLEATLWRILAAYESHIDIACTLMDQVEGRHRLLALYGDLAGAKPRAVLELAGLLDWFVAWDELVKARNVIVHGAPTPLADGALQSLVSRVEADAYPGFRALQNAGVRHARRRREDLLAE